MLHDEAVPLGPGHQRLRLVAGLADPRGKVKQPGPGARLVRCRAVVIAAGIIHEPTEPARRVAVSVKPVCHRNAVERRHFGFVGAAGNRQREGTPALAVAPVHPAADFREEVLELRFVLHARAVVQEQPLVPPALEENALLGIPAKELLGDDRFAVRFAAFEDAHFIEQADDEAVVAAGPGNVVCPPRIGGDAGTAAGRGSARHRLHLEQGEIGEARLAKPPCRRKSCDAAADDNDVAFGPAIGSGCEANTVAQLVAERFGRADDFSGRRRVDVVRAGTTRQRGRQSEERGEDVAAS